MDFKNTTAFKCRYGDNVCNVLGKYDILWEDSENDYQGHGRVFGKLDYEYCYYTWYFGSCSVCDDFEARGLNGDQIESEIKRETLFFHGADELKTWLEMLKKDGNKTDSKIEIVEKEIAEATENGCFKKEKPNRLDSIE